MPANGLPVLPEAAGFLAASDHRRPRPSAASAGPVLMRDTIQTSSVEANLVGNIYFAHYFAWQERLRPSLAASRGCAEFCRGDGLAAAGRPENGFAYMAGLTICVRRCRLTGSR